MTGRGARNGAPASALAEIERFCRKNIGPECCVERLAGDASTRAYYRITRHSSSQVLMDMGKAIDPREDPYLRAAELLCGLGMPVPEILQVFPQKGFVLLEDLGDLLLQRRLADCSDDERERLYSRALDHLVRLHAEGTLMLGSMDDHPAARQALDRERFVFELDFALQHYVEGLRGAELTEGERGRLQSWFEELSAEVASFGRVLCHRDYHSRNLMIHRGDLVIIDFQDARWGPLTYDLASLMKDSYVSLPSRFVDQMVQDFRKRMMEHVQEMEEGEALSRELSPALRDPVEFRRRFDMTCLQRNLKALGTFGYQATVRKNGIYLRYITPTARSVRLNFSRFPDFSDAFEILESAGALPARNGME